MLLHIQTPCHDHSNVVSESSDAVEDFGKCMVEVKNLVQVDGRTTLLTESLQTLRTWSPRDLDRLLGDHLDMMVQCIEAAELSIRKLNALHNIHCRRSF